MVIWAAKKRYQSKRVFMLRSDQWFRRRVLYARAGSG